MSRPINNHGQERRRLNGFNAVVLAGGVVNLLVVGLIIGYWLIYG